MVASRSFRDLRLVGFGRAIALALSGGLPLALFSYFGYLFVPLGHGALIQPACAALGGLALAVVVLKEPLPLAPLDRRRGRCSSALRSSAPRRCTRWARAASLAICCSSPPASCFAIFSILLRRGAFRAMRAATITSVMSLLGLPMLLFSFDNMLRAGFRENLLQAVVQGSLAGAGAIYLFTRAVVLLGAGRAVLFPSLVPPFTLLIGFFALGEAPSVSQLAGLVVVLLGFRLTQKA